MAIGDVIEEPMPGTSRDFQPDRLPTTPRGSANRRDNAFHYTTPEEKLQDVIWQAEQSKAKAYNAPGIVNNNLLSPTAVVDEGYFVVGAHLDEQTVNKIGRGEYIDFGKLLPRDKVMAIEEDCRFEMIIKNGKRSEHQLQMPLILIPLWNGNKLSEVSLMYTAKLTQIVQPNLLSIIMWFILLQWHIHGIMCIHTTKSLGYIWPDIHREAGQWFYNKLGH